MIYKRDMPKCLLAGCKRISIVDPTLKVWILRKKPYQGDLRGRRRSKCN